MSRSVFALVCWRRSASCPRVPRVPAQPEPGAIPKKRDDVVGSRRDFTAQCRRGEGGDRPGQDRLPQEVTFVQGFWLGLTEVTVRQFDQFVKETGYVTDAEKAKNRFT